MPKKDAPCKVTVITPKKKTVDLTPKKSPDGYTCDFKPTEEGPHKVEITYDKKPVVGSPFSVNVTSAKTPGQVEVKGLETPIQVGELRPITIVTSSMPKKDAPCKVTCTSPKGKTTELPVKKAPEGYTTSLTPTEPGPHKVAVEYDKKPVPQSPFTVDVQPKGAKPSKTEPGKSEITVKGLDTPIQTGEKRIIVVVTTNAAKKGAPCKITATNPKGRTTDLKTSPSAEGYEATFTPWDSGIHKIKIEYDAKEVPGSPFDVEVYKVNLAAIVVKGLEKPIPLGETRHVNIITKDCGKPDLPCKVTAIAPSGQSTEVPTAKSPDGYTCDFTPNEPGEYKVKVEYASKELPKSPYKVNVEVASIVPQQIQPKQAAPNKSAPEKAEPKDTKGPDTGAVTVKGLDTPVNPGEKRKVIVDTTKAPKKHAPCKLTAKTPKGKTSELKTQEIPDGYEATFSSWDKGTHTVTVEYDSKEIPDSPFAVLVEKIDVSKVTVTGLDTPIQLGETRKISILTSASGKIDAPCKVLVKTPKGETLELPTKQSPDGYMADFKPKDKGKHTVEITYAGKEVPKSPFEVLVQTVDLSGVKVKGLEKPIMVNEKRNIQIITTSTGKKDLPCKVMVTNPKGKVTELPTHKTNDGHEASFTPTEIGPHKVKVEVAEEEVPGSEFPVEVTKFELKITVDGLDTPLLAGEKRTIKVNTGSTAKPNRFAPEPSCTCTVTNPKGRTFKPLMDKKSDGFETFYSSNEPGPHVFKIEHNGKEIPDSPITCDVQKLEARKVDVKGLETPIEVGETRPITIVTKEAGQPDLPCKVTAIGPKGDTKDLPTKPNPEGYETTYAPLEVGPHKIKVEYAGREIPKSPLPVEVKPKSKDKAPAKIEVTGLDKPVTVGEKRPVKVMTGKSDAPCKITQTTPKGKASDVPTKKTPDGYEATFAPLEEGPYKVKVEHAGKEVPGSPFPVDVKPKVDLGKVVVKGLEKPIKLGEARPISINTKSTGIPDAPCKLTAISPKGQKVDLPTKKTPEGYETVFSPKEKGSYRVKVELDNKEVPKSPYSVSVEADLDSSKIEVKGLETPVEVKESRPVMVLMNGTGDNNTPITATAKTPQGLDVYLNTKKVPEGYECTFNPRDKGPHSIKIVVDGKEVPKSPFKVDVVDKFDIKKVEVKGLDKSIKLGETRPVSIVTSSCGKPDAPCKVFARGPSKPSFDQIPVKKTPNGYECELTPTEVGPNTVKVECNGKELPKSPYVVNVESDVDLAKVTIKGLERPIAVAEPRPITIDTSSTGQPDAPCRVCVMNPAGQVAELPTKPVQNGYQALFAPLEPGPHQVAVDFAEQPVPKSPFPVDVVDPGQVFVQGLETPIEVGEARPIQINTASTGKPDAPCRVTTTSPQGKTAELPTQITPEGYQTVFAPLEPGPHKVNVNFAEKEVPKSPFSVNVEPKIDLGAVEVLGLETRVFLDSPTGFTVDAKSVTPNGEGKVRAIVTSPSGQKTESLVKNMNDGTYDVLYTPYEQGPNTIDITYEDIPIPESPVKVTATPGCDASRVKAYGPGLEGGFTEEPQVFTVDVKGAGQGGLALAIDGPAETQINCKDNRDGTCCVEYVPVKKGDYDITVKFADQHIPGSPFHVGIKNPVNPAKVKCYGPGIDEPVVKTNAPATFTVDATEAGEAPLDVTYTDRNGTPQPADIIPLEAGKYQATYYPVDEGKCKVEVKYANQQVPNSPFSKVVEPGSNAKKVKVAGDGIQPTVLASLPVQFVIDTREAGNAPIDVVIKRPDGTFIRPMIQDNGDGTFTCQYTPEDCGPYELSITFDGEPVTEQPIKTTAVPTGDATKCRITDGLQQTIPVAKETVITVDASEAGTGKVTCRIRSPTGAEIDIDIVENVDGTFSILFTPAFQGDYSISIKFGGQSIEGGDYCVQVGEDLIQPDTVDSVNAAAPGAGLYHPQEFCIPVGPIFNFCTAYIVMPSGKKAYPKIEDNKDGTVTVRYQPQETGLHELHVCYNQSEIQGSPFKFHVDAVNSGFVTAYGPGLSHGVVNVPAEFTIVTKDAGAGGLSLAIEGPSKTEIKCKDNGDGTCTVCYLPSAPGEYNITVKFDDKNISGSPFVAKVTAGEPKQKAQIGRSSEVSLKVTETDITNLTASILSPSGHEEPCMLKRLPNGHLGISFTPRETGEHLVNVYRDGQHIANSPFRITVGESELGNASKVKVYGKGLEEAMAHEVNEFIVDTREAGYGGLSLSIEGPSKADIECHDNEDGTCRVTYKPTEPGVYIINIKFADEHVPGSPYKVKVGGEASEKITERIMRHREAADVTHVGSECELSLKIPGTSPFDMTASVTSPSGMTELCDVVSLDDCHYSIKFVPKEMGIHTVSVKHKDMHIPGSPFQFTVGPIAGGGAHKVHAAGMGLVRGEIDQPNEFNIYTREAGAGGLSIAVEGPSKAEVDFEDRKDGSCGVKYTVTEPGEYMISIKFNDEHIPDSPFRVPITPSIGDAKKLSVSALQSKGLSIGKPCTFVVNFNGAPKGKLQARVVSPSGAEVDALLQEIDDGEYAVRFIPRENGPHLVYVSFDGCQIPDSPFRIQVGTVHADPGMVQAYGEGLKSGKTDQTSKFIVNTVNAGSGALAVTVEGPSKVKMECKEVDEGYEFTYTPTAPGDYLITIKYAGTNIAGSPFKARVEGQGKATGYSEQASVVVETVTKTSVMSKFASMTPFVSDASKVTIDGNGLKKGYRNKQCTFNVDASKAGNNMLFIGMIGPKGPCEELCVKHQPGAPYKITYLVKERGDYMLAVKWGDEHIPGSPFYVKVE